MKKFLAILFMLFCELAMACPGCAGSMANPREKYIPYVLMVFILLTYIPLAYIFKMIIKYKNFENN